MIRQFINLFFLVFTFILWVGCGNDDPLIEQVNGLVINRASGVGIGNIKVDLKPGILEHQVLIASARTDESGNFQFIGPYDGRIIYIRDLYNEYQSGRWVNGSFEGYTFNGVYINFNSVAPLDFKFELYPRTYFEIHVENVAPAIKTDIIKFTLDNSTDNGWLGTHTFEIVGMQTDTLIDGQTLNENLLQVHYEVISEDSVQLFSRTIECTPGAITEIKIDY